MRVRESRRARTARIVGPRRPLELIVPRHVPAADVGLLLESRRSWIAARLAAARELAARPPRLGLEQPGYVPLAGSLLPLERLDGRRAVAERVDGRLLVRGPDAGAPGAIERWYRREARERALAAAARKAGRLGVAFRSVRMGTPARAGAPARPAAISPSRGAWCLHRPRCSTTSSCTSCSTCASRTTSSLLAPRRNRGAGLASAGRLAARARARAARVPARSLASGRTGAGRHRELSPGADGPALQDAQRLRVHPRDHRAARRAYDEPARAVHELQARAPDGLRAPRPRKIDAEGRPPRCVERVNERLRLEAMVERVHPGPATGGGA